MADNSFTQRKKQVNIHEKQTLVILVRILTTTQWFRASPVTTYMGNGDNMTAAYDVLRGK